MTNKTHIRFDGDTLQALKRIARQRSYRLDRNVSWVAVLHEAARRYIEDEESSGAERASGARM